MEEVKKKKKKSKKSHRKDGNESEVNVKIENTSSNDKRYQLPVDTELEVFGEVAATKSRKRKKEAPAVEVEDDVDDDEDVFLRKIKSEPVSYYDADAPICAASSIADMSMKSVEEIKNEDCPMNGFSKENLESVDIEDLVDFDGVIRSDDEVYYLRLSDKVDPKSLRGHRLTFSDATTIDVNGDRFNVSFDDANRRNLHLLVNRSNRMDVRRVQTAGCFTVNPDIEFPDNKINYSRTTTTVPAFPSGLLKQRHPLFGVEYEDRISLDKHTASRLQTTKRKKSSGRKSSKRIKEEPNDEIFDILCSRKS